MRTTSEILRAGLPSREWPELAEPPLPLFPTELLPERCGELVEAVAASMPAPVDYAACALLGVVSAALVGRVIVQPRAEHREPVQLFLGLVGESGTKKSGVLGQFSAPLREWQAEANKAIVVRNRQAQRRRDMLTEESRKKNLNMDDRLRLMDEADQIQGEPELELLQGDTTPEALVKRMQKQGGRGVVYTDEGNIVNILAGVTYGRTGAAANIDAILQGYDGGAVHVDRANGDSVHLDRADLSLTVGLQPALLERMAGSPELDARGFPQRLLFFIPEPLRNVKVDGLPHVDRELLDWWRDRVQRLAELNRNGVPLLLSLTDTARAAYNEYWQSLEDRVNTEFGSPDVLKSWARKAHGKVARLAGLLALMNDTGARRVEASHVRNASALMEGYFIPHAKKAFGGGEHLGADEKAILPLLRGDFAVGQLRHDVGGQTKFRGKAGEQRFLAALSGLEEAGYIRLLDSVKGRGKPTDRYEVNPALLRKPAGVRPSEEGEL